GTNNPGGWGAPPQKRSISLRSIGRFCGGLELSELTDNYLHHRLPCGGRGSEHPENELC
ncbi:MAG: hypothetical protein ACI9NC_006446, partial [Verrucomicrobiales bacterium]